MTLSAAVGCREAPVRSGAANARRRRRRPSSVRRTSGMRRCSAACRSLARRRRNGRRWSPHGAHSPRHAVPREYSQGYSRGYSRGNSRVRESIVRVRMRTAETRRGCCASRRRRARAAMLRSDCMAASDSGGGGAKRCRPGTRVARPPWRSPGSCEFGCDGATDKARRLPTDTRTHARTHAHRRTPARGMPVQRSQAFLRRTDTAALRHCCTRSPPPALGRIRCSSGQGVSPSSPGAEARRGRATQQSGRTATHACACTHARAHRRTDTTAAGLGGVEDRNALQCSAAQRDARGSACVCVCVCVCVCQPESTQGGPLSPAEPLPAASDTTPKAIPSRMGYRAASDTEGGVSPSSPGADVATRRQERARRKRRAGGVSPFSPGAGVGAESQRLARAALDAPI